MEILFFHGYVARTTKRTLTLASQIAPSDVLSLRFGAGELETYNKFQVNRVRRQDLGLIVITTFETERSMTLFCISFTRTGSNLLEVLGSGLLELVECGKDNVIMLPPATLPQIGPAQHTPQAIAAASIKIGRCLYYTTNVAWGDILQPGHFYDLRFSKNNGEVFAWYTDDSDNGHKNLPPAQNLTVGREGSTYYLTVHDEPVPPRIFARLQMPHQAQLIGPYPFTFVIEYAIDSFEFIVIDKSRPPLSVFLRDLTPLDSLIDCRGSRTLGELFQSRWQCLS